MRYCTACKKELSDDAFYTKDTRKRTRCKACKCAKVKEYNERIKQERRCFHCRAELEPDDKSLCKGCKEKRRANYHKNGDRYRANGRKRKRDLRMVAFEAYGGARCVCCGESKYEFLTIDHVDGDGAEHRRSLKRKHGYVVEIYRWLKNEGYPDGFQVLCWNCNCAKAHFSECPHERERREKT